MIPEHELRSMYLDEKMSSREIGELCGVNQKTVLNHMKSYGIKSRTLSEAKSIGIVKPSKEYLVYMYTDKGMPSTEIAGLIGVHFSTILAWLREYKIKVRSNSESQLIDIIKPSKEELVNMYSVKHMSSNEIASLVGVGQSTVFRWMKSYCIETRALSTGENSPGWKNGISFEPYCEKFNNKFKEAVRERDDYTCQLCGYNQNVQKLDVHHIHYDKENCYPDVVALCRSCNMRVNGNRDYWEEYFENHLIERGLFCWSLSQET